MLSWYYKYMLRRQWMDVTESNYLFILVEEFSRYRTRDNLAEDTISQFNVHSQILVRGLEE
jgi:hypothetical protein